MSIRNLPEYRKSGAYLPTISNVSTTGVFTVNDGCFIVVGDVVTCWVSMQLQADITTKYTFELNLPFEIDVLAVSDVMGIVTNVNATGENTGGISASIANDTAVGDMTSGTTADRNCVASFAYRVKD